MKIAIRLGCIVAGATDPTQIDGARRERGACPPRAAPSRARFRDTEPLFRSRLLTIFDTDSRGEHLNESLDLAADSHRLVLTRSGAALYRPANGRGLGVLADSTRAVLFHPGETYDVSHSSPQPHECTVFAFSAASLAAAEERLVRCLTRSCEPQDSLRQNVGPIALFRYHRLRRALVRATSMAAAPVTVPAVEQEALNLLHDSVVSTAPVTRASSNIVPSTTAIANSVSRRLRRELAESTKLLLAGAPDKPHPIDEVAGKLGVSPSHLSHVFRAQVGLPLHQYLLQVRLSAAVARLSDGESDLSRLGLDLGFTSHSHFSTAFRHWFGITPSRARKLLTSVPARRAAMLPLVPQRASSPCVTNTQLSPSIETISTD